MISSNDPDPPVYHYNCHGMWFRSEVLLPGIPHSRQPVRSDVSIRRDTIDDTTIQAVDRGGLWKSAPGLFYIAIEGVARFAVRSGKEIAVEAHPDASDRDVATYLLGSVMGALLYQRGLWPMHASAIQTDKGAVLFAGRSGAGKSTLAAALYHRGYSVISDDISAVTVRNNGAVVVPAIPRMKLNPDTASYLGVDVTELHRDHARGKYWASADRFATQPADVRRIVFLDIADHSDTVVRDVLGADAASLLSKATYRRKFMKGLGLHDHHFPNLMSLAKSVPVSLLHRSTHLDGLGKTVDCVEKLLT